MSLARDSELAASRVRNRYTLVNAVLKRARQLNGGAEPLTIDPADINHLSPSATAMREIRDGRVTIKENHRL